MNYEPYVLFLNGEYWGFYYLTEKYDVQFIEHYYGVDKGTLIDDIIIIKNGDVETGVSADFHVAYSDMMEFIIENDMSVEENYKKACEMLDIDSFIDYFAVLGYAGRSGDWPHQNYALWRSRNISEKKYEDGRKTAEERSIEKIGIRLKSIYEKILYNSMDCLSNQSGAQ